MVSRTGGWLQVGGLLAVMQTRGALASTGPTPPDCVLKNVSEVFLDRYGWSYRKQENYESLWALGGGQTVQADCEKYMADHLEADIKASAAAKAAAGVAQKAAAGAAGTHSR